MAVPRRILCNWFPNWPIQRLVVARPELRGRRVVLFGRDPRRGQLVSAVSPRAMRDGLAVGMPLSEARSLLRRTSAEEVVEAGEEPGFFVFPHDHRADRQAWESLCDQLDGFSPLVGGELETTDPKPKRGNREASPDSILLDITGLGPLFGGKRSLVDRQMEQIERLGYLSRVAVAGTVGAAWALARCFSGTWFRQHGGPLVVPPEDTTWLQRLPITALRLDPALVDTLGQLGIRTVAQLRQLSRDDLALRFGPVIQRRLDQLWGVLEEPLPAHRRSVDWQAEQVLEHPTRHRETMEVVLHRLLTELCERLRREQRGALE